MPLWEQNVPKMPFKIQKWSVEKTMKLKKIESIVTPNKNVAIYTTEGAQWLGDGSAMYPIYGMPHLTEENILTMWDIPEGKREKWHFHYGDSMYPEMFADNADGEQLIRRGMLPIVASGGVLEPLQTDMGVIFINQRYLAPFDDLENGYELYARLNHKHVPYVAVKEGYALVGIIIPVTVVNDKFIAELEKLIELSRLSKENRYGTINT